MRDGLGISFIQLRANRVFDFFIVQGGISAQPVPKATLRNCGVSRWQIAKP